LYPVPMRERTGINDIRTAIRELRELSVRAELAHKDQGYRNELSERP
jgi:hypothetical protein